MFLQKKAKVLEMRTIRKFLQVEMKIERPLVRIAGKQHL